MMLTRSFLKSFFLVPKSSNEAVFEQFSDGWNEIYNTGKMEVTIPSVNYQEQIKTKIRKGFKRREQTWRSTPLCYGAE